MIKINAKQLEVLTLMNNGWELGYASGRDYSHHWLQKGGCGHGGESKNVNSNTAHALYNRKLITQHYSFPTSTYTLTEEAKEILEAIERKAKN